jgi:hypothetical protein
MSQAVLACAAVEELAAFIHQVLCEKDALDPNQTPLFRTPLCQGERVCGLIFHVEGPRLLKTSAVWSADDDRVIFYDSNGIRFRDVKLVLSAELDSRNAERQVEEVARSAA